MTHASTSRSTRLQLALFAFLTLVGFAGLLQTATPYGVSSEALQNLLTPQQSPAAAGTSKAGSQQQQGKQQAPAFELREVRRGVFESPAGLLYLPGSEEGHRIDHVLQHLEDNPRKKLHGVFEGDRNRWLATTLMRDIYALLRLYRLQAARRPDVGNSLAEHHTIIDCIHARDADGAEAAMRDHLRRARERTLQLARV